MAGNRSSSTREPDRGSVDSVWTELRVPIGFAVAVLVLARVCLGLIAPSVAWIDPGEAHPSWGRGVAILGGLTALGLLVVVHRRASRIRLGAPGLWVGVVLGGVLVGRAVALADEGWTFFPPVTFEYTLFLASLALPVLGGLGSMAAISTDRGNHGLASQGRGSPIEDHIKNGVGVAAVLSLALWGLTVRGVGLVLDWVHILSVHLLAGFGVAWWARSTREQDDDGRQPPVHLFALLAVYVFATVVFAFFEGETHPHTAYLIVHMGLVAGIAWAMGTFRDKLSPKAMFWDSMVATGTGFTIFSVYLAMRAQALAEKVQAAKEPLFSPALQALGLVALLAACAYAVRERRGRS